MGFFGTLLKVVSAGLLIVGSVVSGGVGLALMGAGLVIGTIAAQMALMPDVERRQAMQLRTRRDPGAPHPVVYGRTKLGTIVHSYDIDPSGDKKLWMPLTLCHGSRDGLGIAEIETVFFDGNKGIDSDGEPVDPYTDDDGGDGSVSYAYLLGTDSQNVANATVDGSASLNSTFGSWNVNDTGKGLATIVVRLKNKVLDQGDDEPAKLTFPRGAPQVTAIVKGNFVEDTRSEVSGVNIQFTEANPDTITRASGNFTNDGWVAGDRVAVSGSASNDGIYTIAIVATTVLTLVTADDLADEGPSAGITLKRWAHPDNGGDNPAMCVRDYLLSTIYGAGYDETLIDDTSFEAMATYYDAQVSEPGGGTETRFTCNGWVDTGNTIEKNLKELLSSARANLIWQGGVFRLLTTRGGMTALTEIELTDANIVGNWTFENAGANEKYNVMRATWTNPALDKFKTAQTQWPRPTDSNTYLTNDSNFLNRGEMQLPFTNGQAMAQRIAATVLRETRQGITAQVLCTEEALQLQVGEVVNVTHLTPGWTDKTFWVMQLAIMANAQVAVTLREYDNAAYTQGTLDDVETVPDTNLGDLFNVAAPTNVVIDSGVYNDRARVSWNAAGEYFGAWYEIQARHNTSTSGDGQYRTFGRTRYGDTPREVWIPSVRDGQSWRARVRTVNQIDNASVWVESADHTIETYPLANPTFTAPNAVANGVEYGVTFDAFTAYVKVYARENSGAAGADPVETEQYLAGYIFPGDGPFLIPAPANQYVKCLRVAYNAYDQRGSDSGVTDTQSGAAGGAPDGPPVWASVTTFAVTVTTASVNWTLGDSTATTRLYIGDIFHVEKSAGVTSHLITSLESGHTYVVGARHLENGIFDPLETTVAAVVTITMVTGTLGTPQSVVATTADPASVKIDWAVGTPVPSGTYYLVERSDTDAWGGEEETVITTGAGVLTYTHQDLTEAGNTWYFRVTAKRQDWTDSAASSSDSAAYGVGPELDLAAYQIDGDICQDTTLCAVLADCTTAGMRHLVRWKHNGGCLDASHHICLHRSYNGAAYVEYADDLSCEASVQCGSLAGYSGGWVEFESFCCDPSGEDCQDDLDVSKKYQFKVRIETDGGDVSLDEVETAQRTHKGTTACT